jgi:glycosyltransferase involved in cell wall biosynthesis
MSNPVRSLRILGIRGVPAAHGGFETFAERLALYLVEHGWQVTVYCQDDGIGPQCTDEWRGMRRLHIPVATSGAVGTVVFDWKSTLHAAKSNGLILTLGYNTAVFSILYRLKGIHHLINMDGIEWRRQKWGAVAKAWFWLNDWAGSWLGDHLIADHPEIQKHLSTRVRPDKITMIPYGSDRIEHADLEVVRDMGLKPAGYAILVARAEPENSILEVVRAWSRMSRSAKLLVLGNYETNHAYQRAVREVASDEVLFPGAIYDAGKVKALRFFASFYIHGHQVGGTNPSLVEALGAGNAVLAHDNPFNRWVAGNAALYFRNEDECADELDHLLSDDALRERLRVAAIRRHTESFAWETVLRAYQTLLEEVTQRRV